MFRDTVSVAEKRLAKTLDRVLLSSGPSTDEEAYNIAVREKRNKRSRFSMWLPEGEIVFSYELTKYAPGILGKIVTENDDATVIVWEVAGGVLTKAHKHDTFEEVFFVASGGLRMVAGDEHIYIPAGSSYTVPVGVLHEGITVEDSIIITTVRPPL